MKNKMKYGLTLAALAFLVGCSDKEGIQRPSTGNGSTFQDSSSIINSESTSEIDPVELSNYQYYPLPDKTWAIAVGNNKYLEKLTLPEQYQGRKVTQIAENGFKDCGALREISIPSSVLTIGNYAFSECTSLTEIVIPESVTSIGALAFDGCSRLTICCQAQSKPSGWNYNWNGFGCPVVWGCSGIGTSGSLNYRIDYKNGEESITITGCAGTDSKAVIPEAIGGAKVTAIADSAFEGCVSLASIVIPDGVTFIGAYAFSGCASLTKIVIPESVTNIGVEAFKGCASLTGIAIPESVTNIEYRAFKGCSSLTGIVIPEGVTIIGADAFYGCTSLTSIVIPDGVTFIDAYAFYGCSSLTVCCKARSKPSGWDEDWNPSYRPVVWGCIKAGNQDCFEYAVSSIEGMETATITGYAGSDTSIAVPEAIGGAKVTAIADSAFKGCSSLKGIVIPNGVTTIGVEAFKGCTSLTSIVIPESVTSIGAYTFLNDSSLTIYCQAQSKPSGWNKKWNYSNCPVVWGYSENGTSGSLNYRIDNKNGEESI